jgi:hypothetical protein
LPDYIGALQNIRTQIEITNFDLSTIINGFSGGTLVNLFNGMPPDEEEKAEIEKSLMKRQRVSSNGNRILLNFRRFKRGGWC